MSVIIRSMLRYICCRFLQVIALTYFGLNMSNSNSTIVDFNYLVRQLILNTVNLENISIHRPVNLYSIV